MLRSDFLAGGAIAFSQAPFIADRLDLPPDSELAALERRAGGRLGVFAYEAGSVPVRSLAYRSDERFPMCSTFKVLAVSAVLRRVERGLDRLDRHVAYGPSDLLSYAPVTRSHVQRGWLSVRDLCAAAIEWSDNTAANLLLRTMGGPPAVTTFARSIGDPLTRLDRTEPTLNTAKPHDPRDTTTPRLMAGNVEALVVGKALYPSSRAHLRTWMFNCRTGGSGLRAGLPTAWHVADKTGSGDFQTHNHVAAIWRPGNPRPLIVSAYYTGSARDADTVGTVLPAVARIVAAHVP